MAACISADTGVGPSMASGNQVCKKIWADLPIAPMKSNKHIKSTALKFTPKKLILVLSICGICSNTTSKFTVPK